MYYVHVSVYDKLHSCTFIIPYSNYDGYTYILEKSQQLVSKYIQCTHVPLNVWAVQYCSIWCCSEKETRAGHSIPVSGQPFCLLVGRKETLPEATMAGQGPLPEATMAGQGHSLKPPWLVKETLPEATMAGQGDSLKPPWLVKALTHFYIATVVMFERLPEPRDSWKYYLYHLLW